MTTAQLTKMHEGAARKREADYVIACQQVKRYRDWCRCDAQANHKLRLLREEFGIHDELVHQAELECNDLRRAMPNYPPDSSPAWDFVS